MKSLNLLKLVCIFFFLNLTFATQSEKSDDDLPEISTEEIIEFEIKYVNEPNESEKKYLEVVVKPEKFDLNKDRKISRDEIREALLYVTYPKDIKLKKTIPEEVNEHIKNNIDLFVKQVKKDFINFKQFSYLMRKVSITNFMDMDSLKSRMEAKKSNRNEGESEL